MQVASETLPRKVGLLTAEIEILNKTTQEVCKLLKV